MPYSHPKLKVVPQLTFGIIHWITTFWQYPLRPSYTVSTQLWQYPLCIKQCNHQAMRSHREEREIIVITEDISGEQIYCGVFLK